MGAYRDRMSRVSAFAPDLLAADFCDELASSIGDMRHQVESLTKRVSNIEEQLIVIDRKITDCCSDSLRLQVSSLRAEIEALKARPNPTPPTG